MIAHLLSLSFCDTFTYQKEKLDQVPLGHKSKATRKRRLHSWGVGMGAVKKKKKGWWFHFLWKIPHCRFPKSQSNSLWWCHLSLRRLHILNSHVTNTLGLSLREAETRWAMLLSLGVLLEFLPFIIRIWLVPRNTKGGRKEKEKQGWKLSY